MWIDSLYSIPLLIPNSTRTKGFSFFVATYAQFDFPLFHLFDLLGDIPSGDEFEFLSAQVP